MIYASTFDVVGYDGFNYPYAFSIHDFEPLQGRIHQPPPVHQHLRPMQWSFVALCPDFMIIIQKHLQHLITIVILTVMRYCIM